MKKLILFLLTICMVQFSLNAQTTEFEDDFESGAGNWVLEGTWGTTTAQSNSTTTSLTDSPGGNYAANLNISATLATGIDLSSALDANLSFWAIYDIENGNFDYMYVEASGDGGTTWINLATIFGEDNLSPWIEYTYSLGGLVGNSDVKVRFRLFTDGGYEVDGMYIDDVVITSNDQDNASPLILHTAPEFYEGQAGDITMVADLVDISGIATSTLIYSVDGGAATSVAGTNTSMDTYTFVIPAQSAGAQVDYFLEVIDASTNANIASTATYSYIAGQHHIYDNGQVDFVNSFGPDAMSGLAGCAVRFSLFGNDVAYALIRNYTDPNRPNDDFEFHIWADDGGVPGADLITPFMVTPEATLTNTSPMTRVDLTPYAAELAGISGDVFMGYTTPMGETWLGQTTPAVGGRTYVFDGATWFLNTGDDYHFRLVTTEVVAGEDCVDATDINALLGGGINNPQTSPIFNNVDAGTSMSDPTTGWECYGEPDGGGSTPSLENTQWFTFTGDGNLYYINTTDCNGTVADYIDFGDTQMSIYSGADCTSLVSEFCNEDEPGTDPAGPYPAGGQFQTEEGVVYYVMIDGFNGSDGDYCIEMTEVSPVTCADIAVGVAASDLAVVCFDETMTIAMQDTTTTIPILGPVDGFVWAFSTEDISNSSDPFANPPTLGGFGGVLTSPTDLVLTYDAATVANIAPGLYYITPVVMGGAVNVDNTFENLDFSNGCVLTGVSIPVLFVDDTPIDATSDVTDATGGASDGEATVTASGGSGEYTYNWSNGATTATASDLAAGDYSVTISDPNGCAADLIVDVTIGMTINTENLIFEQAIDLTPNPAKGQTTILYNFTKSLDLNITVVNSIGQSIFETSVPSALNGSIDLDIQEYTNGVYFVKLSDGTHQSIQRLVVNN